MSIDNRQDKYEIIILDGNGITRQGLKMQMNARQDNLIVGDFSTSRELIKALTFTAADLIVMNFFLRSDDVDGLNLLRLLHHNHPKISVLVIASIDDPITAYLAFRAGIKGFVCQQQDPKDLFFAIEQIASGKQYISPIIAAQLLNVSEIGTDNELVDKCISLTPKEREVLRCCLRGMKVSQIAEKFSRSIKTISGQKNSAFRRLEIHSEYELFKLQNLLLGKIL